MQSHHTTHTGTNPSHDPTNPAGTGATHLKNEILHPQETKRADQQTQLNETGGAGAYGAGVGGATGAGYGNTATGAGYGNTATGAGYGNTGVGNTGVGATGTGLGGATGTTHGHHDHHHDHHGHHGAGGAAVGAGGVGATTGGLHHATSKDLKEAAKLEKSGERQQKLGGILHSTSMQEKGAAKQAEAQNIAQGGSTGHHV